MGDELRKQTLVAIGVFVAIGIVWLASEQWIETKSREQQKITTEQAVKKGLEDVEVSRTQRQIRHDSRMKILELERQQKDRERHREQFRQHLEFVNKLHAPVD